MCKELFNYSREIVGFDISPIVVERCNQVLKELGAGEESYAFVANILTDKDILPGKKFDLVFVSTRVSPCKALKLTAVKFANHSAPIHTITSTNLRK